MNDPKNISVTTTAGERFGVGETRVLTRLIYKRFGRDLPAAAAAWRRMLQNSCTDAQFRQLMEPGHCQHGVDVEWAREGYACDRCSADDDPLIFKEIDG